MASLARYATRRAAVGPAGHRADAAPRSGDGTGLVADGSPGEDSDPLIYRFQLRVRGDYVLGADHLAGREQQGISQRQRGMLSQQLRGGAADRPIGGPYLADEVLDETLNGTHGVRGGPERSDQDLGQRGDRDDQAAAGGHVPFQCRGGGVMPDVVGVPQGQEHCVVDDHGGFHRSRCSCSLVAAVMPGIAPAYLFSRSVTGVIMIRPSRRTWTWTRSPAAR